MDQATNRGWRGKEPRDDLEHYACDQTDGLIKMARSSCVRLSIRQQPLQALVTLEGKEKCMRAFCATYNALSLTLEQRANQSTLLQSFRLKFGLTVTHTSMLAARIHSRPRPA